MVIVRVFVTCSGAQTFSGPGRMGPQAIDRKSTRLNSSHGYISYAVFCLKKKMKEEKLDDPTPQHFKIATIHQKTYSLMTSTTFYITFTKLLKPSYTYIHNVNILLITYYH